MLDGVCRACGWRGAAAVVFSAFLIGGGNYALPRAFWAAHDEPVDATVAEMDPEVRRAVPPNISGFDPATATVIHSDARRVLTSVGHDL